MTLQKDQKTAQDLKLEITESLLHQDLNWKFVYQAPQN